MVCTCPGLVHTIVVDNSPDTAQHITPAQEWYSSYAYLERLLRSAGIETRSFASGLDFLYSLPMPELRCVVLDLNMPEISGLDLKARLAQAWPQLTIIFITGHKDAKAQQRALASRPHTFLHKPFDDKILLDAIASVP